MKIRKITLENVKSYEQEVIEFHDGINVIAGRNGAGKTTLIEAIGLALFGYMNKDYSYQDFITHGASNGSIRVEFEVDGCLYRIDRTFGLKGTKGWTIFDLQTDETMETHTVEDVNFMLAKILGMQEELSLAELFERIIGVSQGTFTEPFLRSAGGRKEYFERIFMLDSYKTAYQKSSDAASLLRGQCDDLEKELIKLRTRVEDYSALKSQHKEEEQKLADQKKLLKKVEKDLEQVKVRVQAMKVSKEQIQALESRCLQYIEQQKQLEERLNTVKEEIQVSQTSAGLVELYRETHQIYQQVKCQITTLEKKLETQQELEDRKRQLEMDVSILSQRLQTQQENVKQNREKLEREQAVRRDEIDEYRFPLEGIDRELKAATEELVRVQKSGTDHLDLTRSYNTLEGTLNQLEDRLQEWNTLHTEVSGYDERLAEIPQLMQSVAQIPEIREALDALNHTISALETRMESERENMERVGDGLCPLLNTECKTIHGENLREFFEKRVEELETEKQGNVEKKVLLTLELSSLLEEEKRLAALQTLYSERENCLTKLQWVETRARESIHSMHEKVQEVYRGLAVLKKAGYLTDAGDLTCKEMLPLELPQEIRRLRMELAILQNHLHLSLQQIQSRELHCLQKKEEFLARRTEFMTRTSQIENRLQEIEESLLELSNTETEILKQAETLGVDRETIAGLAVTLETFGDVKGQLKKAREELNVMEEGNQIYLTHQQKANELGNLKEQETSMTHTLKEAADGLQNTTEQLKAEREHFDPVLLSELETRAEESNRQFSQIQTLLQEGERRLKELADRLKEMDQTRAMIKERERDEAKVKKALDLMNFIRSVFNTSAEEIAQVFLQFISHEATNIYRQLSGENVQLLWEKDYQVKLKDKHRVRLFKQLSGGEQMSAAFAIRLALLRKFSTVRLGFFDEPTTHLDEDRRMNIAQAIASIREKGDDFFEQIFVISHDDTFTTLTENLIRIDKTDTGASYLLT